MIGVWMRLFGRLIGRHSNSGFFACFGGFVVDLGLLAFPCFVSGLLAFPLCGGAPTFLCLPQRKVGKRKRLKPPAHKRVPRTATVVVQLESVPSHMRPQ
jgi:hypothetical protein